jgi:CRISPR-associated protein Cmr4
MLTLDPVHMGTGQDSMSIVDLPIDREEETGVPRFSGKALKGAFRAHVNWKLKMDGKKTGVCPGDKPIPDREGEESAPFAAVSCGVQDCPICQAFGWPSDNNDGIDGSSPGREGRVFFRDARLAFFPAVTNHGTLWFSTPGRAAAYLDLGEKLSPGNPLLAEKPELVFGMGDFFAMDKKFESLWASWISLAGLPYDKETIGDEKLKLVVENLLLEDPGGFPTRAMWQAMVKRTILLDETTFYRVVETCLERRTCNKINEDTGTVEEGALFSYEALPRNSYLYTRLYWVQDDFAVQGYPSPLHVCELSREGLARMGIGGLQTRGLGSILVESLVENGEGS